MGTVSSKKFIKNSAGTLTEEAALTTSAGAADANAIPALNAAGVLDASIVNAKNTSTGAADAGKVAQLDATGRLDNSMMPVGVGADTNSVVASEAIGAGAYVNIYNSSGFKVRNADASVAGKHAMGYVLQAVAQGVAATIYFEGTNTALTGQTPGDVYLSTTPGQGASAAPTGTGNVVQAIGFATSATTVNFQSSRPIVLA